MTRSTGLAGAGLILFAVVAPAAPAQAATVGVASVVGTTKVQYKAATGKQNKVVVTRSGRTITIDDVVAVKAGTGCQAVKNDKTKVRCTTSKASTRVTVYTYDRNDSVINRTALSMAADGGSGNDSITGGPAGDVLHGGTGADRIWGAGGNDYLAGESGDDWISGAAGADGLHGGAGQDTLLGGDGNDALLGDAGNDALAGNNGNDHLLGDVGDDKLLGNAGNDMLEGDTGRDRLDGGPGNDDLRGDDYQSPVAADVLLGGAGTDSLSYWYATKAVTVDLDGSAGDDGQAGEHDTVGADVENVSGGFGNDHLTGNAGANFLQGLDGNDVIHGGAGDDSLTGDAGYDALYGEAGDDYLGDVDGELTDTPEHLDGGPNATAYGDTCRALANDILVNCEQP